MAGGSIELSGLTKKFSEIAVDNIDLTVASGEFSPCSATVRSMLSTAISLNFLVSPGQLDASSGHGATSYVLRTGFRTRSRAGCQSNPSCPAANRIARSYVRCGGTAGSSSAICTASPSSRADSMIVKSSASTGANSPALLAGQRDGADGLPPPLVRLLPHRGHPGAPRRQRPQVQPEQPEAAGLGVGTGQAVHADQLRSLPGGGRTPPSAGGTRRTRCPRSTLWPPVSS